MNIAKDNPIPVTIHVQFGFNHVCGFWEKTFICIFADPCYNANFITIHVNLGKSCLLFFKKKLLLNSQYDLLLKTNSEYGLSSWISNSHKNTNSYQGHSNNYSSIVWVQSRQRKSIYFHTNTVIWSFIN